MSGHSQNISKQLAGWFQGSFVRPVQWSMWYEQTPLRTASSKLHCPKKEEYQDGAGLNKPQHQHRPNNMTGCSLSFWCNAARKCILRSRAESQTSHRRNYICSVSVLMLLMLLRVRQKTHTFSLMKLFGFCLQAFDDVSLPWWRY